MPPVNITGVPLYDGVTAGLLFVPSTIAGWFSQYDSYDIGFWMGLIVFFGVIIWLLWGDE
jgi:hypothetical protein